jgi:hypothetical protein
MKLSVARVAPRDGLACAHCGAEDELSVQHRVNKGMGGSKRLERLSNGLILDVRYNVWIEQDAEEGATATRMGWKVSKWDRRDLTTIPYWHWPTAQWWLADDEGGRRPATRTEVAEHLAFVAARA